MLTLYSCSQQAIDGLQGWADECGIVLLIYLLHGHAVTRASTRIFRLLGAHPSELLERTLQASRYVGRKHLARLGPDDLGGVNRPARDEDEGPAHRTDLSLADQEEKLSLEHVE
jgi:hypothetical protein